MFKRHGGSKSAGGNSSTRAQRRVRSVFISDTHLGCRYSQAEPLLAFLSQIEPDYLYLVGDIIDGWRLKKAWHWRPVYNRIVSRLLELAQRGTQLRYTPGNHDDFLREFLRDYGFIDIADEFIHYTADEKRLLVLHGDRFDTVEIRAQWLSVIGSFAYDTLMWIDHQINRVRRLAGLESCHFSGYVKRRVKRAVRFVSSFEERLVRHGREMHCDAVVCGHVHTPQVTTCAGLAYFNTGDWVEHRTALVEWNDGSLELLHLPADASEMCLIPRPAPVVAQEGVVPDEVLVEV